MELDLLLVGLLKIILIDIVLGGDNAVVIALACRNLPAEQQKKAIFIGTFGAIVLRIILTFAAVWLLQIPFLQLAGGIMLLWIAFKLMRNDEGEGNLQSSSNLRTAIKTIMMADLVMSLDNILAVAGAASGNYVLIGLGLAISIPLIIWGSKLLMTLMSRFPIIIIFGVALLGYTAGEMILKDKRIEHWAEALNPVVHHAIPVMLAILVVALGKLIEQRQQKHMPQSNF